MIGDLILLKLIVFVCPGLLANWIEITIRSLVINMNNSGSNPFNITYLLALSLLQFKVLV